MCLEASRDYTRLLQPLIVTAVSSRMRIATTASRGDIFRGCAELSSKLLHNHSLLKGRWSTWRTSRLFTVHQPQPGDNAYEVHLTVNGTPVTMELDMGASKSVMSKDVFRSLFPAPSLKKTNISLRSYSGESVKVLGSVDVTVVYNSESVLLPLLIVDGSGPSLLGRNWLKLIRLNWKKFSFAPGSTKSGACLTAILEGVPRRVGSSHRL